jgi:hypothetical protein
MSRKRKHKKHAWGGAVEDRTKSPAPAVVPLRPPGSPPPASAGGIAVQFEDVRRAIERQSYKAALEKAKDLHKKLGSAESKALLIDAYVARIQGMLAKDLTAEAKALADLVVARFPESAGRLAGLQRGLAAQMGDVAALAAPLADPNAAPQARLEAEQAIRKELVDLQALATGPVLPEGHPLRVAAADLARAFAAVTSGAVEDAALELANVSYRSPLASWKTLIRAIASFYRGQDENCRRFLAALGSDSAPGRAVGVLRSVLNESWDESLTPAGRRLVQRIEGPRIELRATLQALNDAFSRDDERQVYRQIRRAVELCETVCPERLERLKQHLSVKAAVADYPLESMISALGGQSKHDAYFHRLFARALENRQDFVAACDLWDRFGTAAVQEGWFAADGPENAFLYLHMAELLRRIEPDHLWDEQQDFLDYVDEWEDWDEEEPDWFEIPRRASHPKRDSYFLFPEQLYERAAALRPDPEIYRQWLDFVETFDRTDLKPDPIARKWAAAFPDDPRPLLYLAESAEERNAFDKALKYVEQAERRGGIDPKVRHARFRLLVAKVVRHLKQYKPDLAAKDFVQLEALPQAAEKDRPAFLLSLKWVHAILQGDRESADRLRGQIRDLLGGPVAAAIVLLSTARACEHSFAETEQLQKWLTAYQERDLLGAIVRTYQIGKDVDVKILLPVKWGPMLAKWFKRSDGDLDSAGLLTMAQGALQADWPEVAYYCCGYGLQKGGPLQARFLFLRGKSLPYSQDERRQNCFAAALELARRVHDLDLVGEIAEAGRQGLSPLGGLGPFGPGMMDLGARALDDEALKKVIEFERRTGKYPKGLGLPFFGSGPRAPCQCAACRRARGEIPPRRRSRPRRPNPREPYLFDDVLEEEEFEDQAGAGSEAEALNQAQSELTEATGIPPEIMKIMARLAAVNGGRIPRSKKDIDRILNGHPELQRELEELMLKSLLDEGLDPFGEPDEEFGSEPPSRPFRPPGGRQGRRKKRRR